ncbi:HAD family hydrolase [Nitrosophilus alvini]|uniref:HAD family hydrolase n=1 Tax=Nitrosophilus alvini TaxID=2714855 RepID=UPI00190A5F2E|nr:HAD family hydrolase [Nitrosophilus alvini]
MKKITILFDLDGTLIDSTDAILESFAYAFGKFDVKVPQKEKILSLIGHPLDFMFLHLGVAEEMVQNYVDAYKERYRVISKEKTSLLFGAREAVELASSFATLGVVTTKTAKYSAELLEHMKIMHFFEVLIGREDVIHPKPHPEPILKAMHKIDARKEHTWMIGDTCLDIKSANDATISSIAVLCGYGNERELRRCSKYVKEGVLEAVELIRKVENTDLFK